MFSPWIFCLILISVIDFPSDTALYPHFFFEMVERRLSPFPDNVLVYGGSPFDKYMCGYPEHDHCANLTAPIYMGGGFYFLSPDLADYITGPDCPRSKLFLPHEDMTTGNYVHSHPKNITMVAEKHGYRDLWRHAVKNPHRLARYFYEYYLDQMVKRKIVTREQVDSWKALVTKNKLVLGLK